MAKQSAKDNTVKAKTCIIGYSPHPADEDATASITEWENGEGFDFKFEVGTPQEVNVELTHGELYALIALYGEHQTALMRGVIT